MDLGNEVGPPTRVLGTLSPDEQVISKSYLRFIRLQWTSIPLRGSQLIQKAFHLFIDFVLRPQFSRGLQRRNSDVCLYRAKNFDLFLYRNASLAGQLGSKILVHMCSHHPCPGLIPPRQECHAELLVTGSHLALRVFLQVLQKKGKKSPFIQGSK